jgi:intracellular sulfur oxidation DsrE/DsrF family protein
MSWIHAHARIVYHAQPFDIGRPHVVLTHARNHRTEKPHDDVRVIFYSARVYRNSLTMISIPVQVRVSTGCAMEK